jgi:hypothetical protein
MKKTKEILANDVLIQSPHFVIGSGALKKGLHILNGTFQAIFITKPLYDPEPDQSRTWKWQQLESALKTKIGYDEAHPSEHTCCQAHEWLLTSSPQDLHCS